jgi:transposase
VKKGWKKWGHQIYSLRDKENHKKGGDPMSTGIIYHGFGVRGYKFLKTEFVHGSVIFHIKKTKTKQRCADCGSFGVIRKGHMVRILRTVPIGTKRVFLAVHLYRLHCRVCGALKQEPLVLSYPKKRWTKALARYVLELLKGMTIEDVATHLGMSWDTVKEIHSRALGVKFKRRRIKDVRYLGVDEIAIRKGHRYLTIAVDLETGHVVWVAEGRKISSLEPFLKRLKRAHAPICAIAMDMWPAYIRAVTNHFPQEAIVFDRYHVISDYNRMLDVLRRTEAAQASNTQKGVYKGVRYLLLKGAEKIQGNSQAQNRLHRLLKLNGNLNQAYILKEELRDLWNCQSPQRAELLLNNWLEKARATGIRPLITFARKLATHSVGILNYFYHRITTAKVEGINNKIKTLKRQAYGYRDTEYFKLRIYFIHEARYALSG